MIKNEVSFYDIFVKKLTQKMGKILRRDDIYHIWLQSGGAKVRFPYALGKAKRQEYLTLLGGGIYAIGNGRGPLQYKDNVLYFEERYWDIVKLLIEEHSPSGAIIAHEKSMELQLKNFELPGRIVLYTRDVAKRLQIGPYQFHFRTLKSGTKSKGKNMFRFFMDTSVAVNISNHTFHTLSLELTLLDVASLKLHDNGVSEDLIIRHIRKYEKSYSRERLGEIVKFRYIRALNRIRSIAKNEGYNTLYATTLDIIKKEGGGCYLHL